MVDLSELLSHIYTMLRSLFLPLLALSLSASFAFAGTPRPIRVLFLGHASTHHNSNQYFPILAEHVKSDAIEFDYQTKPDCLSTENLAKFDAVMLYANHGLITPEQFEALLSFIETGHGFLPIHCASACFRNEPRFAALVGGRFKSHKTGVFQATFLMPTHPILQGVEPYETWDETYVHDLLNPEGRTLLAERAEGDVREPWTWVRAQGKGRIFYTASGHDERTWSNPKFLQMLRNAIVWGVSEESRGDWEKFRASQKSTQEPRS
ncbi:MAG: Type 1 glutamine amidotransferase (GATase1) [Verrucomicrobia bacterium]|nr:MAG: Type 1 glutamine amidotransferase (GATase1) [Verrucomicrobiota bacterium]